MSEPIAALTNPVVFACHCTIEAGEMTVGILVLHDECEPGLHKLYTTDAQHHATVEIPDTLSNPAYDTKLLIYGTSL
ncbi:MAG TPA: hypothetical protein V6D10_07090 [Trichocoleus sp.]|jgi:hypothetical protein